MGAATSTDDSKLAAGKRRNKKAPTNSHCQNCGTKLTGEFCHVCGQAGKEPRRLVIGLVQDVFVDTLAIDGKLARTIFLLLSRPGVLARRYLDGKRVCYSPPFRLYLFASVFFFFAAFWMIGKSGGLPDENVVTLDSANVERAQQEISEAQEQVEAALGEDAAARITEGMGQVSDAIEEANAEEGEDGAEDGRSFKDMPWSEANYNGPAWLEPHIKRLYEAAQRVVDDPRLFAAESRENVPRFMLLAPVIYGITLTLLYFYRRKFFVYDHFIVSLYMHAALYAYSLLAILISLIPVVGGYLWFIPILWGMIQPFLVFRQAYSSNWLSVWIKWAISTALYSVAFVIIITLGLSYSLYQS